MTMFRMRGNAISVAFSNDEHEVLLRLRFENVENVENVVVETGGGAGGDVPERVGMQAVGHMQALLEKMREVNGAIG
jgi:hypothetical protein